FSFGEKSASAGNSSTKQISLNTDIDRPDAFDRFIQFAYWKDYYVSSDDSDLDLAMHANVYVLAERLQALELKDTAAQKAFKVAVRFGKNITNDDSSTRYESILRLSCIPRIIEVVYLNTPPPPDPPSEGRGSKAFKGIDSFRGLLAM